MTEIVVEGPFEWDRVAERFPGVLSFRGTRGDLDGETVIATGQAGDVPPDELERAVEEHRLGRVRIHRAGSVLPDIVHARRRPPWEAFAAGVSGAAAVEVVVGLARWVT